MFNKQMEYVVLMSKWVKASCSLNKKKREPKLPEESCDHFWPKKSFGFIGSVIYGYVLEFIPK